MILAYVNSFLDDWPIPIHFNACSLDDEYILKPFEFYTFSSIHHFIVIVLNINDAPPPKASSTGNQPDFVCTNFRLAKKFWIRTPA